MSAPKVSIVVVNWNAGALLEDCLRSIEAACAGLSHEVLLVDNASSDGSPDRARTLFPSVHLIANTDNVGFAKGSNQGLRAASGEHVLFLNPDCALPPGSVKALAAALDADPKAGAVTCALTDAAGRFQEAQGNRFPTPLTVFNQYFFLNRLFGDALFPGVYLTRPPRARGPVEWISGAVMMVRRSAVRGGAFFDEAFFLYGEDMDASMSLRKDGWTLLYLPDVQASHRVKASTGKSPAHIYRLQVVNPLVCIRRHRPSWEHPLIKSLMGAGYLLRTLAYGLSGALRLNRPAFARAARQWSYFKCLISA